MALKSPRRRRRRETAAAAKMSVLQERHFYQNWAASLPWKKNKKTTLKAFLSGQHVLTSLLAGLRKNLVNHCSASWLGQWHVAPCANTKPEAAAARCNWQSFPNALYQKNVWNKSNAFWKHFILRSRFYMLSYWEKYFYSLPAFKILNSSVLNLQSSPRHLSFPLYPEPVTPAVCANSNTD